MRYILKIIAICMILNLPVAVYPNETTHLDFFTAEYNIYWGRIVIGSAQRKFSPISNNQYMFQSEARGSNLISIFKDIHIVEKSIWAFENNWLRPISYDYQNSARKNKNVQIEFDWEHGVIINKVEDSIWKLPSPEQVMDKLIYQLAIMHDLKRGMRPDFYDIADGGRIKRYYFNYYDEEQVGTPAGTYQALKIERSKIGDNRKIIVWLAKDLDYLPIMLKYIGKKGRKKGSAKLVNFELIKN